MPARLPLLSLLVLPLAAHAGSDVLVDFLAIPGSAGLGAIQRVGYSPYKDSIIGTDFVPLYMYEGKRFYMHASRIGMKLEEHDGTGLDLLIDYRYEGFPSDRSPAVLAGMAKRESTIDMGMAYHHRAGIGNVDLEVLHDANHASHGTEVRGSYSIDIASGRWHWRPALTLSRRSANLNNYYYGVRPLEARATRPAYEPGAGNEWSFNLYGYYEMTQRWRLLGGVGVTRLSDGVRASPIVGDKPQVQALVGAAYDFGSHKPYSETSLPLHLKVFGGRATECNFLPAVTLRCSSTRTGDDTRIWGFAVGRPFIERVNNWPLDFVGYIGVTRHDERGLQHDGFQLDAQIKAYYYGFPWRERVHTRLGFGAGFSLAERAPLTEVRDQARRGRATSKFLNYLDPSVDVSLGDLVGSKRMKETYLGVGISHRSGIFGTAQLLGNINGGSNYFYAYLESTL